MVLSQGHVVEFILGESVVIDTLLTKHIDHPI